MPLASEAELPRDVALSDAVMVTKEVMGMVGPKESVVALITWNVRTDLLAVIPVFAESIALVASSTLVLVAPFSLSAESVVPVASSVLASLAPLLPLEVISVAPLLEPVVPVGSVCVAALSVLSPLFPVPPLVHSFSCLACGRV